jgi:hypothetical protein
MGWVEKEKLGHPEWCRFMLLSISMRPTIPWGPYPERVMYTIPRSVRLALVVTAVRGQQRARAQLSQLPGQVAGAGTDSHAGQDGQPPTAMLASWALDMLARYAWH